MSNAASLNQSTLPPEAENRPCGGLLNRCLGVAIAGAVVVTSLVIPASYLASVFAPDTSTREIGVGALLVAAPLFILSAALSQWRCNRQKLHQP